MAHAVSDGVGGGTAAGPTTVERLRRFFERIDGGTVEVLDWQVITGGYSRAMSKFTIRQDGRLHGYVLRADPPAGTSIIETDRSQEWAVLEALSEVGSIPMPAPRYFDPTGAELGSPAIILDRIEADTLLVRAQGISPAQSAALAQQLCRLALQVHHFPLARLPGALARPTEWDRYVDERIQRWMDAERSHVESVPFMRWVARWLDRNRPPPAPLGLVHGDFQTPNVLVEPDGRFLLVDWELAHVGDPREDLGWWALACATQPPDLIADNLEAFCASYREATGLGAEVLNRSTIDYFTVLASIDVYGRLLKQGAIMARGESQSMSIAYMTVAEPFMPGVWVDAVDRIIARTEAGSR